MSSTFEKVGVTHQVSRTQFCSLIDILTKQMNSMEFEEFMDFLTTSIKVNNIIVVIESAHGLLLKYNSWYKGGTN